jgi:hypothetical protein
MESKNSYNIYIFACLADDANNNQLFFDAMNNTDGEAYGGCWQTDDITPDELLKKVNDLLLRMKQEGLINDYQSN